MTELHVSVLSQVGGQPAKIRQTDVTIPPDYDAADIVLLARRTVEDTAIAHSDQFHGGNTIKRALLIQVARLAALRWRISQITNDTLREALVELLDRDGELILAEWGEDPSD